MIRAYLGSPRRMAFRGVAALIFGIATLVWPHVTLWALVVLWGAYALVDGIVAVSASIGDPLLLHRGWVAFWGLSGVAAGVVTFLWPGITALALLFVIAGWAFVVGVSLIAFAITQRKHLKGEGFMALAGVLSVLLGAMLVVAPGSGALAITWAIGWWASLFGAVLLGQAWNLRHETGTAVRQPRIDRHLAGHAAA